MLDVTPAFAVGVIMLDSSNIVATNTIFIEDRLLLFIMLGYFMYLEYIYQLSLILK